MKDKEKLHQILSSLWKNDDSIGKTYYNQALQDVQIAIDSLQEEPVSEDLEKAARSYSNNIDNICGSIGEQTRNTFKAGAQWREEQLMKNVVLETEVLRDSDGDGVDTPYESWLTLADTEIPGLPESLGLKEGDKVKIVIVKSE